MSVQEGSGYGTLYLILFGVWISPSSDTIKAQDLETAPPITWKIKTYCTESRRKGIQLKTANWIGHIVHTNCLLKHVTGGKTEVTGRRERRRQQLLDDLKEVEDSGNWKRKYRSPSVGSRFGRGHGPVVSHYVSHDDPVIENSISPEDGNRFGFRNISEY